MIVGGFFASAIGLVLGLVCFRLRSHYFALATLAFGEVAYIVAVNLRSLTGGSEGLALPIQSSFRLFSLRASFPMFTSAFFSFYW